MKRKKIIHRKRIRLHHRITKFLRGFTLVELLVVVGIMGILVVGMIIAFNPQRQVEKSFNAQRLADLSTIQTSLDTYYNDHQCYPATIPFGQKWAEGSTVYTSKLPNDPQSSTNGDYIYMTDSAACPQWNVVFSKLTSAPTTQSCSLPPDCVPSGWSSAWACKTSGTVNCKQMLAEHLPDLNNLLPSQANQNPLLGGGSGKFGQAAYFTGAVPGTSSQDRLTPNQFIDVPYSKNQDITTNAFTIEAWIKPDIPTQNGFTLQPWINYVGTQFPTEEYINRYGQAYLTMDVAPVDATHVGYYYSFQRGSEYYKFSTCTTQGVYTVASTVYPTDEIIATYSDFTKWKHIAGVAYNGNYYFYENGKLLRSAAGNTSPCVSTYDNILGAEKEYNYTTGQWLYQYYFNGAVDELRESNVARYTSNFTPPTAPFTPDSNTVYLYHFDGNANDASGNGLNGNIVGNVQFIPSTVGQ